jgi:hypothetical protein
MGSLNSIKPAAWHCFVTLCHEMLCDEAHGVRAVGLSFSGEQFQL